MKALFTAVLFACVFTTHSQVVVSRIDTITNVVVNIISVDSANTKINGQYDVQQLYQYLQGIYGVRRCFVITSYSDSVRGFGGIGCIYDPQTGKFTRP